MSVSRMSGAHVILVGSLLLGACSASEGDTGTAAAEQVAPAVAAPVPAEPAPPSAPPTPPPQPEPPPGYVPPEDWHERALATADRARRAVVAIGWDPPGPLSRRLEAGWLIEPDLVVTSNAVACDAREGTDLRVRTFGGTIVRATIERASGDCDGWSPGIALLRLARAVDGPTLSLRTGPEPEAGEPLLAIGHANHAAAVGGWLVGVGPMVRTEGDTLLADLGVPVRRDRVDDWFGGGSNGAPLIDLDGDVVAVLCCEMDWGPQLRYDDPISEPLLRRRIVLDARYYVAGLWGDALRRELG
jgi:hypothetical protein